MPDTRPRGRWLKRGVIAGVAVLAGGLAIPAYAAQGSPASPQVRVQAAAAAPEVWSASDNDRALTGSAHARFTFNVPAGHFAIAAKANVLNNNNHLTSVHCQLLASSNGTSNWDYGSSTLNSAGQYESMSMLVAHTYTAGGPVVLDCYHNTTSSENNSTLRYVKIIATRVNAITHVAL